SRVPVSGGVGITRAIRGFRRVKTWFGGRNSRVSSVVRNRNPGLPGRVEKESLGMPTSPVRAAKLTKKEMEKYRRLLIEKKNSLSNDLAKTRDAEEETTEQSTQDIAHKAASSSTREFLYSLSDTDRTTLLKLDQALARVADSNYGLCLNCSNLMSEKRLVAVPWAPYCIECQELSEKG